MDLRLHSFQQSCQHKRVIWQRQLLAVIVLGVSCAVCSCNAPLAPSGFLGDTDRKLRKEKLYPFQRSYRKAGSDLQRYNAIYVAPAKMQGLKERTDWERLNTRALTGTYEQDVEAFAVEMKGRFETELSKAKSGELKVLEEPSEAEEALRLETNLVELVPGRPTVQAARYFVPGVGILNRPSVGIEARLRDGATGETVFAFADREKAEWSYADLQKHTYYGAQRREVSRWGKQIGEILAVDDGEKVNDTFPIKPINW